MQEAILKTLVYADLFDYPLTAAEVGRFLVGYRLGKEDRALAAELRRMGIGGVLASGGGFYFLPGRGALVNLRKRRRIWSGKKLRKAKQVAAFLKLVPWIKLIGVTGALAMENAKEEDDIDLMIITAPQRLWLTRGLVVTFLLLTGQYRRPGRVRNRICPNLMMSDAALEFPERSLYLAHEVVQTRPLVNCAQTYERFLGKNRWAEKYLPNAVAPKSNALNPKSQTNSKFKILNSKLLDYFEKLAYRLQLKYMASKRTGETATPDLIRFHPGDRSRIIQNRYLTRLKERL